MVVVCYVPHLLAEVVSTLVLGAGCALENTKAMQHKGRVKSQYNMLMGLGLHWAVKENCYLHLPRQAVAGIHG